MTANKVLIVRNAHYGDFGGGERFPVFLAESLSRLGTNTALVSRSPKLLRYAKSKSINTVKGLWWPQQNWSGYRVIFIALYLIWQLILLAWYVGLIIRKKPDALHIQSKDDFIAGTLAAKLLGKRVLWTDHADLKHIWKNINVWHKNPVGKLVYISALFADEIIAISKSEMKLISDNLSKNSGVKKKIRLIYNGSHDKIELYKSRKYNKFTYLFAGRLVTDKGLGEIIDAFNKLSALEDNVQLQIVGDGPEANRFRKLAAINKDIHFLGHKSDPYQSMINADVFVYPSYHEAFGVSLVEAAMLKLPIIATEVGGIPEIVEDNKTGLLVKPQDSESLYKAMKRLYEDKDLAKSLSRNARLQFEDKFNFDEIVKHKYLPLYARGNK